MKRLSIFFVIFALCFSAFINSYSISIDGYDDGSEWENAETQIILNGESNCKVNFGLVKFFTDPEINTLYLCILFTEPGIESDNSNAGVSIQIDDSDIFIVNVKSDTPQYNVDKYYFESSVIVDDNGGITCEARIGIKHGLPDIINGKLRFYDSDGSPSNVYYFTVVNNETATQQQNSNQGYYTEKHTNSSSDKPTVKNSKANPDSAIKSTTTKKNSGNEMNIGSGLLDLLLGSETTTKSAVTAKEKSSSEAKSTRKSKNENKSTDKLSANETLAAESTTANITVLSEEVKTNTESLDTYKIITIVAGGITLVVISVLGTLKTKKDNNNENDRDS